MDTKKCLQNSNELRKLRYAADAPLDAPVLRSQNIPFPSFSITSHDGKSLDRAINKRMYDFFQIGKNRYSI